MKDSNRWKFWIDVGGTFTDCLAQTPGGANLQCKVLSSGVSKGRIDGWENERKFKDAVRTEIADFWKGYACRFLDPSGTVVSESAVLHSTPDGILEIDPVAFIESSTPINDYELVCPFPSPLLAIRQILSLPLTDALPPLDLDLGTTRGTNALLTRTGSKVAWVTTRGFADALLIGDQSRPDLFARQIIKHQPLFSGCFELNERIATDGSVIESLNVNDARALLNQIREQGYDSLAVCLINGYKFPNHETIIQRLANEIGFSEISASHEVTATIKLVDRGQTTVLDAYLNPLLRNYVGEIEAALGEKSRLRLMTSTGALVSREHFTGKDSVLSGPAGGVVGFSRIASQMGIERSIGLDMGGTSTDVARFDGEFERQYETTKAGVKMVHPILAIETVAAGGGSICKLDGGRLKVGPESAGADPGPASYGRGGPLTITDINLYLGRIDTDRFPFQLDVSRVEEILRQQVAELKSDCDVEYSTHQLAAGYFDIAAKRMAKAIHSISVARGYDPRDYLLVAFGGASPQMACAVADELEMNRILIHPYGAILSAVGISMARPSDHQVVPVGEPLSENLLNRLSSGFEQAAQSGKKVLLSQNVDESSLRFRKSLDLRYLGNDGFITVEEPVNGNYVAAFEKIHQQQFGYLQNRPLEVVSLRLETHCNWDHSVQLKEPVTCRNNQPTDQVEMVVDGISQPSPLVLVDDQPSGTRIEGPAMLSGSGGTTIVDRHWHATRWEDGRWLLEKNERPIRSTGQQVDEQADPILLEVFESHFGVIAEQMGLTLQKTAISVNVKERLDFSCALFNGDGELIVNAPHIPVHLGAMSETVKSVIGYFGQFERGDVVVTNDPYSGGSHLPDVTVVSPVFVGDRPKPDFFVASRCHHAEIGGLTPGSMPPNATCLGEEGVLISNFKAIENGKEKLDELRHILSSAKFPSRSVEDNLSDIVAQIAANRRGDDQLQSLVERYGVEQVIAYMGFCLDAAETKMQSAIKAIPDGQYTFCDSLDCGAMIRAQILVEDQKLKIDFTGTSEVQRNNLNANRGIVVAAVIYCMRLLIDRPLSLNDGILRPVDILLPKCFLNPTAARNPEASPPVVGGNVETSQRIVDVLLGALELAAASQGTMNNLLIGNESFGYYETICGGSGATDSAPGADAVHTHMTNTRMTDPEVLESRFPMRVTEFRVRENSGGRGCLDGGNGVIREIEFLAELDLTIISNRRGKHSPFGLRGGEPGKPGRNILLRKNGESINLAEQVAVPVKVGDRIRIETPGGGGFGTK